MLILCLIYIQKHDQIKVVISQILFALWHFKVDHSLATYIVSLHALCYDITTWLLNLKELTLRSHWQET